MPFVLPFFGISWVCHAFPVSHSVGFQQPLHAHVQVCVQFDHISFSGWSSGSVVLSKLDQKAINSCRAMLAGFCRCITLIPWVDYVSLRCLHTILSFLACPFRHLRGQRAVFRLTLSYEVGRYAHWPGAHDLVSNTGPFHIPTHFGSLQLPNMLHKKRHKHGSAVESFKNSSGCRSCHESQSKSGCRQTGCEC